MGIPDNKGAPCCLKEEENWELSRDINFFVEILNATVCEICGKFLVHVVELIFDFTEELHLEKTRFSIKNVKCLFHF